VTQPISLL